MSELVYFDTSALAKWYINEASSDAVERYLLEHGPVAISDLNVVEMRSLLARRRREGSIDFALEIQIFAAFGEDMRQGFLNRYPLSPGFAAAAANVIALLPDVPIRTLDALHLAVAREIGSTVATFDRIMADGAVGLGLSLVEF